MMVDVKVTKVPGQIVLTDGTIEILTGNSGFTVIVTIFEIAGFPVGQTAFDVKVQVIASS